MIRFKPFRVFDTEIILVIMQMQGIFSVEINPPCRIPPEGNYHSNEQPKVNVIMEGHLWLCPRGFVPRPPAFKKLPVGFVAVGIAVVPCPGMSN